MLGSWLYLYDGHVFEAHQKTGAPRIDPLGEFTSAPAGNYRCKEHKKSKSNCKAWVVKVHNNQIVFRTNNPGGKDYMHNKSYLVVDKYKFYLELRNEAAKGYESASSIVKRLKSREEFAEVAGTIVNATLESIVRDHRQKLDRETKIDDWSDLVGLAPKDRRSSEMYLGNLNIGNEEVAVIFGLQGAYDDLETAESLNFQFLRNITSKFDSNACCISIIKEDKTIVPVLFILYQHETYETLKSIIHDLLTKVPGISKVQTITTELNELIVKSLRVYFQTTKIRCTWYTYLKEITRNWIDSGLPFDLDSIAKKELKILKYAWAIPLAIEHGIIGNNTLTDIIPCLTNVLDLAIYPETATFKEKLIQTWDSRIKFVLPYSSCKMSDLVEITERCATTTFALDKEEALKVLDKIRNYITNKTIPGCLLNTHAKRNIIDAGQKLQQKTYTLAMFLENCLTNTVVDKLWTQFDIEQLSVATATATAQVHDLADHPNTLPDVPKKITYKKTHFSGLSEKTTRQQRLQKTIDETARNANGEDDARTEEEIESNGTSENIAMIMTHEGATGQNMDNLQEENARTEEEIESNGTSANIEMIMAHEGAGSQNMDKLQEENARTEEEIESNGSSEVIEKIIADKAAECQNIGKLLADANQETDDFGPEIYPEQIQGKENKIEQPSTNQSGVNEAVQQSRFFAGQQTVITTQIFQKPKKYLNANLKISKAGITGPINSPKQKVIHGEKREPLSTLSQVLSRVKSTPLIQGLTLPIFAAKEPKKPIVYIDQTNKKHSQLKKRKSQSAIPKNISTPSILSISVPQKKIILIKPDRSETVNPSEKLTDTKKRSSTSTDIKPIQKRTKNESSSSSSSAASTIASSVTQTISVPQTPQSFITNSFSIDEDMIDLLDQEFTEQCATEDLVLTKEDITILNDLDKQI